MTANCETVPLNVAFLSCAQVRDQMFVFFEGDALPQVLKCSGLKILKGEYSNKILGY